MPKTQTADHSTRVLRLRLKDKHAPWLRERAAEVNFVWNYCNETSRKVLEREQRFISAYELDALTAGATKEGLPLHSQTVQAQQREAHMFTLSEIGALARRNTEQTSALFHYAGRGITEKDLLDARRDAHFREAVRKEAEQQVEQLLNGAHGVLLQYARDLQNAGCRRPLG